MATTCLDHEEPTYESPSAFLEALEYDDSMTMNSDLLQYSSSQQFEPFKPTSRPAPLVDPLLNDQFNSYDLNASYWNPSQFGQLDTINPTLSPLDGNQSCDTGYVSQEGSSGKSPLEIQQLPTPDSTTMTIQPSKTTAAKPRKRSNAKKSSTKDADVSSLSRKSRRISKAIPTDSTGNEEDDTKREQFLARNREAASKCRQKKKVWTQDLEERARDLASQKQMLTTYLAMLKNELLMLKCKCLEHSDCDCEAIRDYLKTTVSTMSPANNALYSKLEHVDVEDINGEIARKQSAFDMAMSPSTDSMGGDVDLFPVEAKLDKAAED